MFGPVYLHMVLPPAGQEVHQKVHTNQSGFTAGQQLDNQVLSERVYMYIDVVYNTYSNCALAASIRCKLCTFALFLSIETTRSPAIHNTQYHTLPVYSSPFTTYKP